MRFHVLGIPHTVATKEYSSCAFTQKAVKLCQMLMLEGHEVIFYGHADSVVECDRLVPVTNNEILEEAYPGHDWRVHSFPNFAINDRCYEEFYRHTIASLGHFKQPGDFLLATFGHAHKPVADAHPDLICVESGIGYPHGTFARFRVFESYAIMHAYQGVVASQTAGEGHWYDAVIPNSFDIDEFEFNKTGAPESDPFMLFLGRVNSGKGIHIATDIARHVGMKLAVAGTGDKIEKTALIRPLGNVGPAQRKVLLSRAKVTICASTFLEPFCGVQIESMISGTPVVSSDWGAFAEYNLHGITGYRCKTFEQFCWAAKEAPKLDPIVIREWGLNFSLAEIAPRYTEYFNSVADVHNGKGGWYAPNPDRTSMARASNSWAE